MHQFVPNFVSYVSAKYYWNSFTVIAKLNRVNYFYETQCIYLQVKAQMLHTLLDATGSKQHITTISQRKKFHHSAITN